MRRWAWRIAGALVLLGIAGFLVAASGVVPIKASSGHWPITEWFLKFSMHRSFATHSLGVQVPPLDDPALVVKGATHYDFGCRSCHGSPGSRPPRVAQGMTPPAPQLAPRIGQWDDAALFALVKHGVKFTGMPAWPSQQRDDEVWAMVAFLRVLPGLDADGYRELAHGPPAPTAPIQTLEPTPVAQPIPAAVSQTCVRCHGARLGRGSAAFPELAGQRREYLENSLLAFAEGRRHSGIMQPIAAALSDATIRELARYYAELPRPGPRDAAPRDPDAAALGRRIAHEGIPSERIPACIECHGPTGRRASPAYPRLAGQPAGYLELQLRLFKTQRRGGSPHAHLMDHVAPHLDDEQASAVARYFAALREEGDEP